MSGPATRVLRPYQLMCAVCSLGGAGPACACAETATILEAIARDPDAPVSLRANVGEVFGYQDPGPAADSAGSPEFNLRRDLEILHRMNLAPGATLPARILLQRLLATVESPDGICGYPGPASAAWAGCPRAAGGFYERGRARGADAVIAPRGGAEMRTEKEESLAAMGRAARIAVRPHILLCAVCQYGGGVRPPYPEDNLPELLQLVFRRPETLITLAPHADWMMCAPCPYRVGSLNACVNNRGSGGLPNQMRDLRVLQRLGLAYGATMEARPLFRLLLERIPGTLAICRLEPGAPSVWWTGCGAAEADSEKYAKGRAELLAALA